MRGLIRIRIRIPISVHFRSGARSARRAPGRLRVTQVTQSARVERAGERNAPERATKRAGGEIRGATREFSGSARRDAGETRTGAAESSMNSRSGHN